MNLLYLTFGENISNHIQAHFSILSFLTHQKEIRTINVITDVPSFYNSIKHRINIIKINEETLKEWKGEYDFFWRIKIKAIEMLCSKYKNEPVVYLDSDTFLYSDIKPIANALLNGTAFMHEKEGELSRAKSKTEKRMWQQVKNGVFGDIKILASHAMWNAGVVATPNHKNNSECLLALQICDEMCSQGVTKRLIEQFALSVALHETYGLQEANNAIAHYWSNKENWNSAIEKFLLSAHFKSFTVEQTTEAIKDFNLSELPVKMKAKNTNKRLKRITEKFFPHQDLLFVKNGLKQEL
jgi:hypothetical protein